MDMPAFNLKTFGRFDSRVVLPDTPRTEGRVVEVFEIEVFLADQPGACFIDDQCYGLRRGTVLCAKPGQERHSILPFQCHYYYVTTEDPGLLELLNSLPDCMHTPKPELLTEIFRDPAVMNKEDPNRFLLRQSYFCMTLHRMLQLGEGTVIREPECSQYHRSELTRIVEYIAGHLSNPLTLEELSGVANLSPNYLHRLFTARFGCTPNRYITAQRIQLARSRLAYTDQSLAQIAMDCGFSSQSYFTRCFSRETGKTPMQYRKEMQSRIVP